MPQIRSLLIHIDSGQRPYFLPPAIEQAMRALSQKCEVWEQDRPSAESFAQKLAECRPEVVVGSWHSPRLPCPTPEYVNYVCYLGGSVKGIVARRHLEEGLQLTNWGGSISRTVAEAALYHLLACLRHGPRWTMRMHVDRSWGAEEVETASLFGRRVGVYGFGLIAQAFVTLIRPFECEISAFVPGQDETRMRAMGVAPVSSLLELCEHNDVVVCLAPLTDATRDSVSEEVLRRIRPGGAFVNVGRGEVVDENALARVAAEGNLQVGLDVFREEPLPASSPLRGLENVSLTPHVAGPTHDRRRDAAEFALANLRAYTVGQPLQAVVTPEIYDAST